MVKVGQRIIKGVNVAIVKLDELKKIADQSALKPVIGKVILTGWDGAAYQEVAVDADGKVKVVV